MLSQVPKGETKARPVAFASKTLSASQSRYPAHRLELLALKWDVCEKFGHWLKGRSFTVWTDNNLLTYLLIKPKLDAYEIRWVSKLASYSFELKHLPGKGNVMADALRRDLFARPVGQRLLSEPYFSLVQETDELGEQSVQAVFRASCQSQALSSAALASHQVMCNAAEVMALCQSQVQWISGAKSTAVSLAQHVQRSRSSSYIVHLRPSVRPAARSGYFYSDALCHSQKKTIKV